MRLRYRTEPQYLSRKAKERIRRNEKNILISTVICTALGFVLMCIAVGTTQWVKLRMPRPHYINETGHYFISSHSGLWKYCLRFQNVTNTGTAYGGRGRKYFTTKSNTIRMPVQDVCYSHPMFPSKEEILNNPRADETSLHYSRAEGAFAVITIFIMAISHIFSIYTFTEPRFMFKRLAGLLYFLAAANCFVTIEMVISSHLYEEKFLPVAYPKYAIMRYGFSFYFTCIALAIYILASLLFIIYSHKRKEDQALTTEEAIENRPMKIGR